MHSVAAMVWSDNPIVARDHGRAAILIQGLDSYKVEWRRYHQFREGRDLLATMGYACLSMVQIEAGGRSLASSRYSIERNVLDTLGRLTSDIGDEATARKFDQFSTRRPHTPNEKAWIEATVKRLIHRVAEHDYNPTATLPKITMADLPPL